MFQALLLADSIRNNVPFRMLDTGWCVGKCQLCGDYKERAGFKFDDPKITYNCWNCGVASSYEEHSGRISNKMRSILTAYGIDDSNVSAIVNSSFFSKKEESEEPSIISLESITKVNTQSPTVKLPVGSIKLGSTEDYADIQIQILKYLDERCIDVTSFPFYFSLHERMLGRVIIPFYRNGNLIYWQARSIKDSEKKRYDNCITPRDTIIFNVDALNSFTNLPLFVAEGVFDAMTINGIAILGSKLSEAQKILLSKSNRPLIFLIDKDKNGKSLAHTALALGHEIAFAPDGAADINQSVVRFGKLWTINEIMKTRPISRDDALTKINLMCK